uniref:F-box domain-containing protein n=1 Tax=Corethron hystrix TaxID=216773 RepID=A0A7S1BDU6_9STRA|mmetsp:Transcript_23903/g.54404  ORF Transcript_23903/g.54404 Transcript_23903/m.54404 type:complete len:333 (+) Transcript_23903:115-1113(+)
MKTLMKMPCSPPIEYANAEIMTSILKTSCDASALISSHPTTPHALSDQNIPDDVFLVLISFLPTRSVLELMMTDKDVFHRCSTDIVWDALCQRMWKDKVNVPGEALRMRDMIRIRGGAKMIDVFKMCYLDSKRQEVTKRELCSNPWYFRFKGSAGSLWTSSDPWWSGGNARRLRFLPDGKIAPASSDSIVCEKDNDASEHLHKKRKLNDYSNGGNEKEDCNDPFAEVKMRWRFITRPLDCYENRPVGAYIRISINGRDVPTYHVRRSPTNNWGFTMENCWGVYASFNLPKRGTEKLLEDQVLISAQKNQMKEALYYNNGVSVIPTLNTVIGE